MTRYATIFPHCLPRLSLATLCSRLLTISSTSCPLSTTRYYVGHKGKFGHEFLEFEFSPNGAYDANRFPSFLFLFSGVLSTFLSLLARGTCCLASKQSSDLQLIQSLLSLVSLLYFYVSCLSCRTPAIYDILVSPRHTCPTARPATTAPICAVHPAYH